MMLRKTLATLTALGLFLTASQTFAATISIVNQVEGFLGSNKAQVTTAHNGTTQVSYDATGVDKLVVVYAAESGFNNTKVLTLTMSFNGVAMTQAAFENTAADLVAPAGPDWDGGAVGLFYLDNPFQGAANFTAGITLSGGGVNGGWIGIIGLAGTADGVGNTGATWSTQTASGNVSTNLTTSGNNAMVIAGIENSGRQSGAGTPTAVSPLTLSNNGFWGSQWGSGAAAYQAVPLSGTALTPTFTTNAGGNIHVVAAEFLVVPEPATFALLALGGLMMLPRHRKA